jgi:hypothetical protein
VRVLEPLAALRCVLAAPHARQLEPRLRLLEHHRGRLNLGQQLGQQELFGLAAARRALALLRVLLLQGRQLARLARHRVAVARPAPLRFVFFLAAAHHCVSVACVEFLLRALLERQQRVSGGARAAPRVAARRARRHAVRRHGNCAVERGQLDEHGSPRAVPLALPRQPAGHHVANVV